MKRCHRLWITTLFPACCCIGGGYSFETWLMQTTLPQQARLCDVAGVGTVSSYSDTHLDVAVSQYWIGNPGSNTLHLARGGDSASATVLPTNIVFFATTNMHYQVELADPANPFRPVGISPYHWDYRCAMTNTPATVPLTLLGGDRAWFPASEGNGQVMAFASNLVHCVRIQPNAQAYYSLLRNNGTGWTAPERIAQDVRYSLWMSSYFDGTNILSLMVADTNLDARIRSSAEVRLNNLTP